MAKQALLFSVFLATALGSVISERTNNVCKARTEGFDTPISLAGGVIPALFGQVGSGTYGELQYSGASKVNMESVILPGVEAKSPPNTAAIGSVGTAVDYLTNRIFGSNTIINNLNPSTTITPVAGKVTSFDLKSLWFGCATGGVSEFASLSAPCVITVTGKDINGVDKSTETIGFGPDQVYNSTLGYKEFVGWNKMKSVTMRIVDGGLAEAEIALFFDDFKYCAYYA